MLNVSLLIYFILTIFNYCNGEKYTLNMKMPGVTTENSDSYLCASYRIPHVEDQSYILSFESTVAAADSSSSVHQILLFGCKSPYSVSNPFACNYICSKPTEKMIFAWTVSNSTTTNNRFAYPSSTGMPVGGDTGINYIVMQVHYLNKVTNKDNSGMKLELTRDRQRRIAGIMLLFSYYGVIDADKPRASVDVSCKYTGEAAYPLAVRVHTHKLGRSGTVYRVSSSNGQINEISKLNPQWPQSFYRPMGHHLIQSGDIMMLRCLYDSSGRKESVRIGSTRDKEMCNFFVMLVTRNVDDSSASFTCGGNEYQQLWKNIPHDSLEYSPEKVPERLLFGQTANDEKLKFALNRNWKVQHQLGQVSSVTMLPKADSTTETLVVFHRGSRSWSFDTFRDDNVYAGNVKEPIKTPTLLEIDPATGKVLRSGGANLFYMPHGVTATVDGRYLWVTDVALHQVMRLPLLLNSGSPSTSTTSLVADKPDMIFGERFVPGNNRDHFCKPTKVAIDQIGNILVADGYCNSRVICFYANGTYADEWRPRDSMFIVHSIVIETISTNDVSRNIVWVADRNNRRILAFSYDGNMRMKVEDDSLIPLPVYAIAYSQKNRILYGVESDGDTKGQGLIFDTDTLKLKSSWIANDTATAKAAVLKTPHDLCITNDGYTIYVAELNQRAVLKFNNGFKHVLLAALPADKFKKLKDIVHNINPTYFGIVMLTSLIFIALCISTVKLIRVWNRRVGVGTGTAFLRRYGKKKRYGQLINDQEGFEPLNQDDPDEENNLSDPETEEFNAVKHSARRLHKKPTV